MYLFYTPDIETSHSLSEEESAHCVRVLRYDRGDEILLTDGRGTTYHARITNPHPRHCEFEILSQEKQDKTHNIYLHVAVILQCLIAALTATALTYNLKKRFELNWLISIGILVIQYGITLLNRFVAQRRYSYFNSIETEGIAYSLWVFFFLSLLGILYDKNKKSILTAAIWAVVLISIRKQMLVTLPLIFLCILYVRFMDKRKWYLVLA